MKTKSLLLVIMLLGSFMFFQACNDDITEVENDFLLAEKNALTGVYLNDSCTYDGVLTEAEVGGIMAMREEEKLAMDVYQYFYELHSLAIFNNISNSEASHTNAVLNLINGYNLVDPALEGAGEFSNPTFTELYAQLTEQGSASLIDALKVGAFIEEYDINDLFILLGESENADVILVYNNLLKGSKSHLQAFVNILGNYGESYSPQVLDDETYNSILSEEISKGQGGGQGQGNGQKQANGSKQNKNRSGK